MSPAPNNESVASWNQYELAWSAFIQTNVTLNGWPVALFPGDARIAAGSNVVKDQTTE